MTKNEKDALINYMDGQLIALCQALKPHMDPDAVGLMFDEVYSLLHDLQETIIPQENIVQTVTRRLKK